MKESIMTQGTISESVLQALQQIAHESSARAAESLGMLSGDTLTVARTTASTVELEDLPCLQGNPEQVVVGVHFSASGDITGDLLAFFTAEDALWLINHLLDDEPRDIASLEEMELSLLGEAGNIIVSSFLGALESLCGVVAVPSPPEVAIEMSAAVLTGAVLPSIAMGGNALVVDSDIEPPAQHGEHAAACRVFFLPTADSWVNMYQAFQRSHAGTMPA